MQIRKLISICIGCLFALGGLQPAFATGITVKTEQVLIKDSKPMDYSQKNSQGADIQISEKQAIEAVRAAFPELLNDEPEVSLDNGMEPDTLVWRLQFTRRGMPGAHMYGYHAMVSAYNGEILQFSYPGLPEEGESQVISREKAKSIAEKLAARLQPEKFKLMRLQTGEPPKYFYGPANSLNLAYNFQWCRTSNGLPVESNGINISIDALSGRVLNYSFNWQENLNMPHFSVTVPEKDAAAGLMRETGMYLAYYVPHDDNSGIKPAARLVYRVNSRHQLTDALTGDIIDYEGRPVKAENMKQFAEIPAIKGEMNPPSPGKERISPAMALEKATTFFRALGYEGKVERSGGGSGSGPFGREEFWSFMIRQGEERYYPGPDMHVGIELFTGRIVNFHSWNRYEGPSAAETKSITRDEAFKIASSFIKEVEPQLSGFIVPEANRPVQQDYFPVYDFRFSRVVNGIPFPQDGISISVGRDGKILSYNCEWHQVQFPRADAIISSESAAEKWLESSRLKLAYYFPRERGGIQQAKLVYQPEFGGVECIDALSGEAIGWDGKPLKLKRSNYDFIGSWAEEQLKLLGESGFLPPPDKFTPSSKVTRRDAIRLIMAAAGGYYDEQQLPQYFKDIASGDEDYNAIQRAAQMKIIEKGGNFLPENTLTRQSLAEWMVNSLGYREVASMPNTIKSNFKDISGLSPLEINYAGLANGLGLLSGDETGKFRPQEGVTWEELSAAIMKLAPKLRNRTGMFY
ncbi:MAG: YcdB/YcdC domain-containing protein [Bacillota bacterium]